MVDAHVFNTRLFGVGQERRPPEPPIEPDSVGVALSGGGSRSMVACMGQLRALRHLGLLERTWGISSASGGTWAAAPYTFLPERFTDDDFLGPVVPSPRDLTWSERSGEPRSSALNVLSPNNLGRTALNLGMVPMIEKAMAMIEKGLLPSESWPMMIGSLILEPYGLYDADARGLAQHLFTQDDATYERDVQQLNPGVEALSRDKFHTVEQSDRPFFIANTALVPQRHEPSLLPFEMTPLAVGVPGFHARLGPGDRDLGGGYISPFAMGSTRPMPAAVGTASTTQPPRPFSLADLVGMSSVAPAEELQVHAAQEDALLPCHMVWPASGFDEPRNAAWPYLFADGGNLENTAIVALTRRPLRRICSFLNSETPLARDAVTGQVIVDSMVPPLFGYQPHSKGKPYQRFPRDSGEPLLSESNAVYRHNQVFSSECFFPLIDGLFQAASEGGAAMFRQDGLRVLPNKWFGVEGGHAVDVLWVYSFPARGFLDQLSWSIRFRMRLPFSGLRDFPYFNTATQLHLDRRQTNLLAHLAAWTVLGASEAGHAGESNAAFVRRFFGKAQDKARAATTGVAGA